MVLPRGLLLSSMVLSVLSGLVPDKNAHLTILELIDKDTHVCNFPPKEMLQDSSKASFLKTCRTELYKDPSNENDTLMVVRDNPSYILCMGVYDLSIHICKSGVPAAALFNNSEQFRRKFQDDTHSDSFCSEVVNQEPLEPVTNLTRPWVTVMNNYLASEELCDTLCMQKPLGANHLCKVIAWGRKLLAVNAEAPFDDPSAEVTQKENDKEPLSNQEASSTEVSEKKSLKGVSAKSLPHPSNTTHHKKTKIAKKSAEKSDNVTQKATLPLLEENLTQNGAAQMEQEAPTAGAAAVAVPVQNKSTPAVPQPAASQPGPSSSSSSLKSVPASVSSSSSSSVPVNKSDKSPAPSSTSAAGVASKAANAEGSLPSFKKPEQVTKSAVNSSSAATMIATATRPDIDENQDNNYNLSDDKLSDVDPEQKQSNNYDDELGDERGYPEERKLPLNEPSKPKVYGNFSTDDPVDNESNFYAYFLTMVIVVIAGYVLFHNKQKILALLVEGRRGSQSSRRGRPNSSNYRKLDTNLEEAITSPAPRSTNSHVIY